MDIFIRGLHNQCTVSDLERALWDPLRKLGIEKWHIRVMRHKGCAILTLLHVHEANYFLQQHGTPSFDRNSRPREQLTAQGRMIYCHAGKQPSDEFILRSLLNPAEAIPNQPNPEGQPGPSRPFQIQSLACGLLEIPGPDPVFVPYWQDTRLGSVTFAHKTLAITLAKSTPYHAERIIIPYNSVQFIGIGNQLHPFIIITLYWAPRFYNEKQVDLSRLFQNLALNPSPSKPSPKFARLLSIDNNHAPVVGTCLVYRLQVPNGHVVSQIYQMLQTHRSPPSHIPWAPKTGLLTVPFDEQKGQLVAEISNASRFGTLNFAIRFQVQRLAQNGVLPPHKVIALLPKILSVSNEHGAIKTAEAIRMLARDIPYVEPDTSPEETSTTALGDRIAEKAACFDIAQSIYGLKERHTHLVLVYRAQVTPTGVYLEGPDAEVTNRVLRKYADHPDHFMRVEFKEDDGRQFRHEKNVSAENVYQNRFRHVLGIGIQVAGRTYRFLGFSHSSLREQSAWFLAPFYHVATQELMVPGVLIGRLGKFSHFLSPARCAARIGQAFSDTSSSIYIGQTGYRRIKDVERVQIVVGDSGPERVRRTFSDGVGTVSRRLLRRIWRENKMWKVAKPTLLQIRFAGAKGMISLDSRLQGEVLNIRESMIKFESIEDWNLEICGEATKPLPMFLNRQLIKILEDLGVDGDAFISIQRKRIRELRSLITHPLNAETFLEENFVGRSTHIPLLIRMLHDIGHPYQADEFLTHCVEMALLHQVREMKYRGRISLDSTQGATLYGIMDETDFLQEGQVYVAVKRPGWTRSVLSGGRLAVTRSPAMHPGDVQLVSAVEAPPDSPLNELSNCIVFSSKGTRDLPSMLSGGDLDGDQYHVIYDPVLVPNRAVPAANYPRVPPKNLDRVVEIPDMLDFFVDFMEQDRLGQICTAHLQLADQKASGVRDPDCIKLAELASSAVDFSKNGVPADMTAMPKYSRARPDFMAPGPRVKIQEGPEIATVEDDTEKDELLAGAEQKFAYYPSQKVLGKLFREIDEVEFLKQVREDAHSVTSHLPGKPLMETVWDHIKHNTMLVQWNHLRGLAEEIRHGYEENLVNLMYEYSTQPQQPLTEIEAVTGVVFGYHESGQSKRFREACIEMKEQFGLSVEFTTNRILHADGNDGEMSEDALALATACFTVAMENRGLVRRHIGQLKSFRYIAAALCLREIRKIQPDHSLA